MTGWFHYSTKRACVFLLSIVACVGLVSLITSSVSAFGPDIEFPNQTGIQPGTDNNQKAGGSGQQDVEFIQLLETILKLLYLLLRPMLAIAGAAMDNTLVYGKIFYLDTTLRKFWQIMRAFANYTLGLVFVGSIIVAFFRKSEGGRIKSLVKNLLLGSLLINLSRWLVAVLIDISTIAVVSIGALPLHALGDATQDEIFKRTLYLKPHQHMNLSASTVNQRDKLEQVIVHSCANDTSDQGRYFLPCRVENGRLVVEGNNESDPQSRLWYKAQFIKARDGVNTVPPVTKDTINDAYCVYDTQVIANVKGDEIKPDNIENRMEAGTTEMQKRKCSTINDLLTKAMGTSGPLYTLYASIFHMARISLTVNQGDLIEAGIEMGMKAIVGIALMIPLLALAVALVVRVVILWGVIAFSPILVLAYIFGFKQLEEKVKAFSLKNVLGIIFLPVFAVFAISVSVIFMTLISNITMIEKTVGPAASAPVQPDGFGNDVFSAVMGEDVKRDCSDVPYGPCCYSILNITEICFTEGERTTGANIVNTLSWLVVNMFGVALMWMIIFAVLKSNEITGGIAGSIEGFGMTLMKSAPIIPIGSGVGIGAVEQALQQTKRGIQNRMDDQYRNSDLAKMITGREADISGDGKAVIEDVKEGRKTIATAKAADNQTFDDYNAVVPHFVGQAKQQGVSFASEPTNRKEAFNNKDFVAWAQNQKDGDRTVYDKLYENRMKQDLPGPKTERANTMEGGYDSLVADKEHNKKIIKDESTGKETTLYWSDGKVTSFERVVDKNNKVSSFNVTTKAINETDITSKEDLETFQRLLNEKYKSVEELQKQLGDKYKSAVQALLADQSKTQVEVTVGGKKYMLDTDVEEDEKTKVKKIVGIKTIQDVGGSNPPSPTT